MRSFWLFRSRFHNSFDVLAHSLVMIAARIRTAKQRPPGSESCLAHSLSTAVQQKQRSRETKCLFIDLKSIHRSDGPVVSAPAKGSTTACLNRAYPPAAQPHPICPRCRRSSTSVVLIQLGGGDRRPLDVAPSACPSSSCRPLGENYCETKTKLGIPSSSVCLAATSTWGCRRE